MTTVRLPAPGLLLGDCPERGSLRATAGAAGLPPAPSAPRVCKVRACVAVLDRLSDDAFAAEVCRLRLALQRGGLQGTPVTTALALGCVAFRRALGIALFDTQLIAAGIVLEDRLAEMATGEGKTCAVALAAVAAALAGVPVHVVTANDHLVSRDAQQMAPMFALLGLRVGALTQDLGPDARRRAYACDVTYCTAKELVFDYLRDGLGRASLRERGKAAPHTPPPAPLLRGLCMAIVDEADHVLIDEARVPLVLAQALDDGRALADVEQALRLARALDEGRHFHRVGAACALTAAGAALIETEARGVALAPSWRNRLHRDTLLRTALYALHGLQRDRDYLVRDGRVLVVDPATGRVAPGRAWSLGLQQAIELKEGVAPSVPQVTAAQITYQRFFARYLRLSGVSGTLAEARGELSKAYGRTVRRVPLRVATRRRVLPTRLFGERSALWHAVAQRVAEVARTGRPVLVGTDSVADSEALSRRLGAAGIAHAVLNAHHDARESAIVARAGRRGAVTVSTQMAGRGTDIALAEGVDTLGGLHVISCQLNASRRLDRQLAGRCARQGDAGSVETWLALDAPLLRLALPEALRQALAPHATRLPSWAVSALVRWMQRREEQRHRQQRARLLEQDQRFDQRWSLGDATR